MRKGEAECKQLAVVTVHTEPHVYMIYFKPQHSHKGLLLTISLFYGGEL